MKQHGGGMGKRLGLLAVLVVIAVFGLIRLATATLTNARNDQLVLITNDRGGGAAELINASGDQATVYTHWHQTVTVSNGRGDVLETGTDGGLSSTGVSGWTSYEAR